MRLSRLLLPWLSVFMLGCNYLQPTEVEGLVSPSSATRVLWQADLGDGRYRNPILHIDYSDPDVVAVGNDYFMTASSFNSAPGLPILHSTDLVNWQLINYALPKLVPEEVFAQPQHGNGVWAPTIRYHQDKLWIFYPDPDFGIYVTTASDPAGKWSVPKLILPGKGIIDPTPLWDDDGQAWLLHGWAKSRAGFNNVLSLRKMAWDARSVDAISVEENYLNVVDGNALPGYRTLEGPKFYRRNGYYYIFAPAGGVEQGWQSVFRSKSITGPYEAKVVMDQGNTNINGPHQGAWVHTSQAQDWFLHFQSRKAYGRIVHLQPMHWHNDWPVIGEDPDGDGIGQPVYVYPKPLTQGPGVIAPQPTTDEFVQSSPGLQWQWNANPQPNWYQLLTEQGELRLFAQPKVTTTGDNLWSTPSLLLQKWPADSFEVRSKINISNLDDASAGLLVFGEDYAWLGIVAQNGAHQLVLTRCKNARTGCDEVSEGITAVTQPEVELRLTVLPGALVLFSYRFNQDERFTVVGEVFEARRGRWVGAKVGVFAVTSMPAAPAQWLDVDYIRFAPLGPDMHQGVTP